MRLAVRVADRAPQPTTHSPQPNLSRLSSPVFRLLSPYLTVLPRTNGVWRNPVARLLRAEVEVQIPAPRLEAQAPPSVRRAGLGFLTATF